MDRERYSRIAHGELAVWNPVPLDALVRLATRALVCADTSRRTRVLDVGCGRAGLILELARSFPARAGVQVVGVDTSALAIEAAREALPLQDSDAWIEFRREPFDAADHEPGSFDLVGCIGSLHAVGGLARAFDVLGSLARPSGHLLLGEGYWRREPAPAYLEALGGGSREDLGTHEENLALVRAHGWRVVDEHLATHEEWDHYEGTYARNIERHLEACPDDPDAEAMRARMTSWSAAYREHGRDTLGFGVYLCRRDG